MPIDTRKAGHSAMQFFKPQKTYIFLCVHHTKIVRITAIRDRHDKSDAWARKNVQQSYPIMG